MTALAYKIFRGGVNEAERNEHDHTNSARKQKTERNCKKRASPIIPFVSI
jgi:hypothetical protein